MAPCILPPFQNLANCADGYYQEALGVTPSQDVLSPVSIAAVSPHMQVIYNTPKQHFFVDQTPLIWQPGQPYQPACLNGRGLISTTGGG
jgi:hypothetical protein